MRYKLVILFVLSSVILFSQENQQESVYKKKVLEAAEIDLLMSYYSQNGDHAAVTGGIGNEALADITPTIIVTLPLNVDDVLTVEAGISAYTSASSGNLNPFDTVTNAFDTATNASSSGGGVTGSPWVESSGASNQDVWVNGSVAYAHSSDDRNTILTGNISFATEYDYTSIGFGGGITKLFNQKNTEVQLSGQVYFDSWAPQYPTELSSFVDVGNLNTGFFGGVTILDQDGSEIDKNGTNVWSPLNTSLINDSGRNTYSLSFGVSQILNENMKLSMFLDVVQQKGWLANPSQRVYFGDRPNYYIGNANSIANYASPSNEDVFQLADDIERLPDTRFKLPIGVRFNYFLNEKVSLRTYYRYYFDDWGVNSHTASFELPIKIGEKFTVYPSYRYYKQTAADYFAPYEGNLSTQEFYTSDYDLSEFDSSQYGLGIKYTDIFAKARISIFGLKSIDLRYSSYNRSDGLKSGIVSFGIKFVN